MPVRKPGKDNSLLRGYFERLGLTERALARGVGIARNKAHFALRASLSEGNAERVANFIAGQLDLSERERLALKAEVMGRPGNLVRAYFGTIEGAMDALGVSRHTAIEILTPHAEINGNAAEDIRRNLEGAPDFIAGDILSRIGEPKGTVTYRARGLAGRNERARTRTSLLWGKPATHEALRRSGLSMKELYMRAGIGKETLRKALYKHAGSSGASAIAHVLAEASGLSESARETVERELREPPRKSF